MKYRLGISLLSLILLSTGLYAQKAQWNGPDRNNKYPDKGLMKEWPEGGPKLILKKEGLGGGFSTPVYAGDVIYVTGRRDSLEVITALNLDGTILWETVYGKAWMDNFQETRNTPAVENGRIYITAGMGTVNCIDAATGKIIWSRNTHREFEAEFHRFGMAESVLLTENAVISTPAGGKTMLVALDKKDGSLLWKTPPEEGVRSYTSPILIRWHGLEMILAMNSTTLIAVNPQNGELFWSLDLINGFTDRKERNNTNTPLYKDGEIFISSGYNDTACMLKLADDGKSVSVKWTSDVLDNHHGGLVEVDGYIYGANWISNGRGNWVCLNWDTGEVMYEEEWYNKGSIIWADGMLYIFEEKFGNVGLFETTPDGMKLKGSFVVEERKGPRWAHPSIYDGKLFIRHLDQLLVYDIRQN